MSDYNISDLSGREGERGKDEFKEENVEVWFYLAFYLAKPAQRSRFQKIFAVCGSVTVRRFSCVEES